MLNVMRGQIRIIPESAAARERILNILTACGITRVIAPKPKADRQPATKIVLKNETYGEHADTIAAEIFDCIGIKPTTVKKIGKTGRIHLLIFDAQHKTRELLECFKTTERRLFCAPSIKVEQFKENPRHITQCKKCFAFDHAKQSCYGAQEEPQITVTTPEGNTTRVCRNCKAEDHGANNVKCPAFQNMIARQMAQAKAKEEKLTERLRKSSTRTGVMYADVTSQSQFPNLPHKEPIPQQKRQQTIPEQSPLKNGEITLQSLYQMILNLTETINRMQEHFNGSSR